MIVLSPPQGRCPAGVSATGAERRASGRVRLCHRCQYFVQVERRRLLAWRELGETVDLLGYNSLAEVQHRCLIDDPVPIGIGIEISPLEGIATQAEDVRHAQLHERLRPDV